MYNWLCRQFNQWQHVYVFMNLHDSGVLFVQWSTPVSVWKSFWVCSGNSFPLYQLRRQAAWLSHFSDHTLCPVCCGLDMSGSFVKLSTMYSIPMGFTDPLWRRFDTSLALSHALVVCLNVMWVLQIIQRCTHNHTCCWHWAITDFKVNNGISPIFIMQLIFLLTVF